MKQEEQEGMKDFTHRKFQMSLIRRISFVGKVICIDMGKLMNGDVPGVCKTPVKCKADNSCR